MNVDNLLNQAQALRHEAKQLLASAADGDKALAESSVAFGNAPVLFPSATGAVPSRNSQLEKVALQLGDVYAQLETAKNAYAKAEGGMSFHAVLLSSEANMCLGVMTALGGYLSGQGLIAGAAAAALGGGKTPAGYQKSSGGILVPDRAA